MLPKKGGGGGTRRHFWWELCGSVIRTLTFIVQTKICNFPVREGMGRGENVGTRLSSFPFYLLQNLHGTQ